MSPRTHSNLPRPWRRTICEHGGGVSAVSPYTAVGGAPDAFVQLGAFAVKALGLRRLRRGGRHQEPVARDGPLNVGNLPRPSLAAFRAPPP